MCNLMECQTIIFEFLSYFLFIKVPHACTFGFLMYWWNILFSGGWCIDFGKGGGGGRGSMLTTMVGRRGKFKKTEITLKPVRFWRNIAASIFKFCPFYISWKLRWKLHKKTGRGHFLPPILNEVKRFNSLALT